MSFLWKDLLWLLMIIPVIIIVYVLIQKRRQKYALRFASLSLVKEALGKGPQIRRHIPPTVFLVGLTILIGAVARPAADLTLPSQQGTVILTIDVSGSMAADDIKPSRIEAAKAAASLFVQNEAKNVRIGVVSFSGSAFIIQAPTKDKEVVLEAINRLEPMRNTAVGSAILTSLDAIFETPETEPAKTRDDLLKPGNSKPINTPIPKGTYAPAAIILLSDGESNTGPNPLEVVQQAVDRGVRVYTVGMGSVAGTIVKVDGRLMRVKMDEEGLTSIAEKTNGAYFKAGTETDLNKIYDNLGTQLVFKTEQTEITALFVAVAGILLLISVALSLIWFNRIP